MQLLINPSLDPAFNLALEEYALARMDRDLIMLWRNAPSVIIGRNQNAVEEMDMAYVRAHGITVIRRQSGGGAVFHDLGNVNFTVIQTMESDDFSNYQKFTVPICEFLRGLGVDARLQGRNDLLIDGAKCSGNAQAVRDGRIMHHGTLLFDADVGRLAGALKPRTAKIESKGIKSVRSRVTNIAEHLPQPMTVESFFGCLAAFFRGRCEGEYALTGADRVAVERLVSEKYGTWAWNIGSSPAYDHGRSAYFPFGMVDVRLSVEAGIIRQARVFGDFFGMLEIAALEERLVGIRHEAAAIRQALGGIDVGSYIHGMRVEDFVDLC